MSRVNGDKARFHRIRKQRISLRQRTRKMLQATVFAGGASAAPKSPQSPAPGSSSGTRTGA